jgi:hypothetical protein
MSDSIRTLEAAAVELLKQTLLDTSTVYGSKDVVKSVREAAEMDGSGDENFDGWLPLRLAGSNRYYDYTAQELKVVRDAARTLCDVNEVAKNILLHYRNFVVGSGVDIDIFPEDLGDDPVKLSSQKEDAQVRKMKANWKLFVEKNKLVLKLYEWVRRRLRDGEVYIRIFDTPDAPTIRFVDPTFIDSNDTDKEFGIQTDPNDAEEIVAVVFKNPVTTEEIPIPVEDLVIEKNNVDSTALRGITSFWPCMSNFRRLEKILVNSSVLATVQAAITMVRKHDNATGPKVERLIQRTSDGVARTDATTGRSMYARKVRPGTILDAPKGIEYQFPSHTVDASAFIKIAEHELAHIGNAFVLPIEWLLTSEPKDPLTPGSPVVANFRSEQTILFIGLEDLFWKVQARMGVNVERNRLKYTLYFNGERLAVGKALDEARVDEILLRNGATSPQEIAAKHGNRYVISRTNVIKHRQTAQPGEAMPGDSGNTNPSLMPDNGGDGTTTKDKGQRLNDGDGGTNA